MASNATKLLSRSRHERHLLCKVRRNKERLIARCLGSSSGHPDSLRDESTTELSPGRTEAPPTPYGNEAESRLSSFMLQSKALHRRLTGDRQHSRHISTVALTDYDCPPITSDVKPFESIPGPPTVPFLGGLVNRLPGGMFYKKENSEVGDMMYEMYGPVIREKIINFDMVHVYHPDDVEAVYRSDGKHPQRHAFFMLERFNRTRRDNVQGLLTSQDENWRRLRSNVQQKMLRPKAVAAYLDEQGKVGDDLMERIADLRDDKGEVEDLREHLYNYATECIGVVCFNTRLGALRNHSKDSETSRFIQAVNSVMDCSAKEFRTIPLYLWFDTKLFRTLCKGQEVIKQMAEKYTDLAVQQRLAQSGEIHGEEGDLIPYLLTKTDLSKEDVLTVISEFIFAGVDTTSHYLSFVLYCLAKHPDVQEKLTAEVDSLVPPGTSVTSSAIGRMSYLKAVLKETLRYQPVTPGNCRTTGKDLTLGGYHVPKGSFIALHSDWMYKQEKYFPRAKDFIPERWLRAGNWDPAHPFSQIPFGFGPRSCIGKRFAEQEVSLAVVKILQKYRLEYHHEDMKVIGGITFTPVTPLKFRFVERSQDPSV